MASNPPLQNDKAPGRLDKFRGSMERFRSKLPKGALGKWFRGKGKGGQTGGNMAGPGPGTRFNPFQRRPTSPGGALPPFGRTPLQPVDQLMDRGGAVQLGGRTGGNMAPSQEAMPGGNMFPSELATGVARFAPTFADVMTGGNMASAPPVQEAPMATTGGNMAMTGGNMFKPAQNPLLRKQFMTNDVGLGGYGNWGG